jgi:hypothetical protein
VHTWFRGVLIQGKDSIGGRIPAGQDGNHGRQRQTQVRIYLCQPCSDCGGTIVCSDTDRWHRGALAALNRLDMDRITRDGVDGHHNMAPSALTISTAPLPSPTTTYQGPPPPYSCSSSATPSNLGAFDYISPPSSRRTTVDDKASVPRQSLPSIKEALGGDGAMPFSASNIVHPPSVRSRTAPQTSSFGPGQSLPEAPSGPPNPFSQGSAVGQTLENDSYTSRATKTQDRPSEQQRSKPAFPSINTTEPISTSSHNFDPKSPKPRSAHPMSSNPYSQSPLANNYQASFNTSPTQFPPYRSPYAYSAESSNPPSSKFPTVPDYSRFNPAFKFDDRKQSIPRSHPVQPYSDSVKRHLDIFDIEMALNEVCADDFLADRILADEIRSPRAPAEHLNSRARGVSMLINDKEQDSYPIAYQACRNLTI